MIILGVGVDILDINRLKKLDNIKFIKRISKKNSYNYNLFYLAKVFCTKESIVKSLGCGFINGFSFKNIIIYKTILGKPRINFTSKNITKIFLSISHEKNIIISFSILFI